jgi:hypothetical protein
MIVISIAACATLGGVFAIIELSSSSDEPSTGSAHGIATEAPDARIAAGTVDAALVETPPIASIDAPDRADAAPAPTIASASAAESWAEVLQLCGARKLKTLSVDERTSCGIAACNAAQRATAVTYRASVGGANQAAIDKTCKDRGIVFPPPTRPPPVDPCERNPLKCRT